MPGTTTASELRDQTLVEMARQGDQDAFGELVRRHQQKCVDIATFFLRNRGDAEDEVQRVFEGLRAPRSISGRGRVLDLAREDRLQPMPDADAGQAPDEIRISGRNAEFA